MVTHALTGGACLHVTLTRLSLYPRSIRIFHRHVDVWSRLHRALGCRQSRTSGNGHTRVRLYSYSFTTCTASDPTAQVGHVHRYFQPPCLASVLTGTLLRTTHAHFRTCHAKCVNTRYTEGELTKGESVCIDRCVAKFFEANKKVGERLQSVGANAGTTGTFGL